jgi:hypothetical protein
MLVNKTTSKQRTSRTAPVQVSAGVAVGTPDDHPPPSRGTGRGGAPPLNLNHLTHGAYLNTLKRGVRATRDKHRRKAEAEAHAILVGCGLERDPLAGLVARQVRRLETMAGRLEAHLDTRGVFLRDGSVKPAVASFVSVVERLLGEARRLLEQLAASARPPEKDMNYVCHFADGTMVGTLDAPAAAPPARVARLDAPGDVPISPVAPGPPRADVAPVPPRSLSPFARDWMNGDDL